MWRNKMFKKLFSKNKQPKMGHCNICNNDEEEILINLLGIDVCEGCYHDLINHMRYKNIDDLLECDKKQLNKFLNKLAELKKNA